MPMGDYPCSQCGQYWCGGHWVQPDQWVVPFAPVVPSTGTSNTFVWPPVHRLHQDDIEAIAKRVVELLLAEKSK